MDRNHIAVRKWRRGGACLLVLATQAISQATAEWRLGFGTPGVVGVNAFAVFDAGDGTHLYAGGLFSSAAGLAVSNLARWDGRKWSTIGDVDGRIDALLVVPGPGGPSLFVGGAFTHAGGVAANGVARFDAQGWHDASSGLVPTPQTPPIIPKVSVREFAIHDDGSGPALLAGGNFSVTGSAARNLARWNGIAWVAYAGGTSGDVVALASFDRGSGATLVAAGAITMSGPLVRQIASWDGNAWTSIGDTLSSVYGGPLVYDLAVFDDGSGPALYAAGQTDLGTPGVHDFVRWNGQSWTSIGTHSGFSHRALAVHDDGIGPALYIAGQPSPSPVGSSSRFRWNGTSLTTVGSADAGTVYALASFDPGTGARLFEGGLQSVRWWDGAQWRAPAEQGAFGVAQGPLDFAIFDDGSGPALHISNLSNPASPFSSSVARMTLDGWVPLGPVAPINQFHRAESLLVHDDGSGSALYEGGRFQIGTSPIYEAVRRWTGAAWVPVGGLNGWVTDLVRHDDGSGAKLYASGSLQLPGGAAARIAKWDGAAWSAVATAFGGAVGNSGHMASVDLGAGPRLFAVGSFTSIDGVAASGVAQWNGTAWQSLGTGVTFPAGVGSVTGFDDGGGTDLYIGGLFQTVGGAGIQGIARWDGAQWTGLGLGSTTIASLEVHDDGSGPALYAGGMSIPTPNGTFQGIARWRGTWSGVGGGLGSNSPNAQTLVSGNSSGADALFVGGFFNAAGGTFSSNIAVWAPPRPVIAFAQPAGPGTGVLVRLHALVPGHEYLDLISPDPCPAGPGSGPYGGLCFNDPGLLVAELQAPVGSAPFRFVADSNVEFFGPYTLPPGVTLEALSVDVSGGAIGLRSLVTRFGVN